MYYFCGIHHTRPTMLLRKQGSLVETPIPVSTCLHGGVIVSSGFTPIETVDTLGMVWASEFQGDQTWLPWDEYAIYLNVAIKHVYTVNTYIYKRIWFFSGIKPSMNVGRFFPRDVFFACLTAPIPTRKGLPSPLVRKLFFLPLLLRHFSSFHGQNNQHNDPESVTGWSPENFYQPNQPQLTIPPIPSSPTSPCFTISCPGRHSFRFNFMATCELSEVESQMGNLKFPKKMQEHNFLT